MSSEGIREKQRSLYHQLGSSAGEPKLCLRANYSKLFSDLGAFWMVEQHIMNWDVSRDPGTVCYL